MLECTHDGDRRYDLQQVRSHSFEETPDTLAFDRLSGNIHDAGVGAWVVGGALCLHPCPKEVERIDETSTECSTEASDRSGSDTAWVRFIFRAAVYSHIPRHNLLLEEFEGRKIDCRIGEHTNNAHWQATVEGSKAGAVPHPLGCFCYESIAVKTTLDRLALHAAPRPSA